MNKVLIGLLVGFLPFLVSCSQDSCGTDDPIAEEDAVLLDSLFATPTTAELSQVQAEFSQSDLAANDVELLWQDTFSTENSQVNLIWIISHASDGYRHYGAVIFPTSLDDSLPILLYAHWGDDGVSLDDFSTIMSLASGLEGRFVHVIPSFRSETLEYGDSSWTSEGTPSPWFGDVLDGLRLVSAAESLAVQNGDPKIGSIRRVIGFSRGGGVALLSALRDSRYDRIVDYFGPTDFFGDYVRNVVDSLLAGNNLDLPGLTTLDSSIVQPLLEGTLSLDSARLELLRRSPARFASQLPPLQIHHGTADQTVDISQSDSLWKFLERDNPEIYAQSHYFVYEGAGHSPVGMLDSIDQTVDFLLDEQTTTARKLVKTNQDLIFLKPFAPRNSD
ncbi:MAG TPA: hypothetical protein VLM37_07810 [Fibrobacteraceae bacterium]|nr:hypothetical protein [Fibrobacteraceae bacterium]